MLASLLRLPSIFTRQSGIRSFGRFHEMSANDWLKLPIYIGKWPDCGCVTAACVDDPNHKKDTAKFIANLIKDGRVVERISAENWHTVTLCRCKHRLSPKQRKASTDAELPLNSKL
jgi:hypothetical protein